ncbi:ELMO domain-containing protein 3 [Phytophthora citrophthora]|uniref:ELMO domain-containing protein 3 n=1 Tax=Phytophthora citrophthora TaxID=4793 RepID=A0AAD9GS75_9STRA|nr:ELMO domain-containing protein 3 [Phytophthora citrophthora]
MARRRKVDKIKPFLPVEGSDQGDNTDEFHDSSLDPASTHQSEPDKSRTAQGEPVDEAQSEEVSPLSGQAVVEAVLNLARDDGDEEHEQGQEQHEEAAQEQESALETDNVPSGVLERVEIQSKDEVEDAAMDGTLDAVIRPSPTPESTDRVSEIVVEALPSPPDQESIDQESSDTVVAPPPAPVSMVVGSMNPVEEDNDDSDDSQGEEEVENAPPLQLNIADDDEDVLEVDAAVVSSLQIEEKQRLTKRTEPSKSSESSEPENALLKALPSAKMDDSSAIDLSLGEEIRAAHVTTLEPSSPFSDMHKMAGSATDSAFGISYQSMRKKAEEFPTDGNTGNYSLPSGPAFPDEREFENEMELTSDVSFSVATTGLSPTKAADDDEFSFDPQDEADTSVVSEEVLKARRESLEEKKRKEEEELLKELKRATDEEKKNIESSAEPPPPTVPKAVDTDALSLTELHGIYKRGLGDQEVLMDETDGKQQSEVSEVVRSSSVLGRIFSQKQGTTETIEEELDGDDSEKEEGEATQQDVKSSRDESQDTDTKSDEWKEIKLVQHRQSHENSSSGLPSNSPEAATTVSYAQASDYFAKTEDVMQHRDIIVAEDFPRNSCIRCLSRPRLTFPGAIEERDRVFCIAATAFDAHNDIVVGILQTIYRKITKTSRDVPLIGRHWEDIGFQGSDPSTDLRGCGVLSLLQILYLVDTYPDLALRFHALSQHPTRHFPFSCVLINVTLQCVVALRAGALYPECNKQTSVLTGVNRLYISLTSKLHDAIQSRSDEIPLVMKEILDRGRSNPLKTIDDVLDGHSLRPSRPVPASKSKVSERKEEDNNVAFTEIGLHAVEDE